MEKHYHTRKGDERKKKLVKTGKRGHIWSDHQEKRRTILKNGKTPKTGGGARGKRGPVSFQKKRKRQQAGEEKKATGRGLEETTNDAQGKGKNQLQTGKGIHGRSILAKGKVGAA